MRLKTFSVGLLEANAHVFWNPTTHEAVIFDCGGDAQKLDMFLKERNLKLTHIILTHGHCDHIAGVEGLKALTQAQVVVHKNDQELLSDPNLNMSVKFPIAPISFLADLQVADEETLDLLGAQATFVHTPGHTRGSMCIAFGEYLVTGDTLFKGSIGRTDLYGGNMAHMQQSLNKLQTLSHRLVVLSGHGPQTTLRDEVKTNPYMR